MTPDICVCVPARNEAAHLVPLIQALAEQTYQTPFAVAICVNNSSDHSRAAAVAAASHPRARARFTLEIIEREFEPAAAHAGSARGCAMDLGAALLADDGLLISTDADCRPPPNWIEANLAQFTADRIIGGRIVLDEREAAKAPAIFALRVRFDDYWRRVREIEDMIDPKAWDPAPRHGDHTGASLALSVDLYHRAGGVPLLATGEDRALVNNAIAAGGKLVHPEAVWTRASPRTAGRATGGMAADMRRWTDCAETGNVPTVPAFEHWEARARWRHASRQTMSPAALLDAEGQLPALPCDLPLPDAAISRPAQ
jgi:GT2 family glycosyltransferase